MPDELHRGQEVQLTAEEGGRQLGDGVADPEVDVVQFDLRQPPQRQPVGPLDDAVAHLDLVRPALGRQRVHRRVEPRGALPQVLQVCRQ